MRIKNYYLMRPMGDGIKPRCCNNDIENLKEGNILVIPETAEEYHDLKDWVNIGGFIDAKVENKIVWLQLDDRFRGLHFIIFEVLEKKMETYPNCWKCMYWYDGTEGKGCGCGAPMAIRECWEAMDAEKTGYLFEEIEKGDPTVYK